MKAKDLRERSLEDLKELDKSLTADTFQNRFKNFTNRLDDTSQMRKTRRDVARVKTLIKQLSGGAPAAVKAVKPATAKKAAPKAAASAPASKPAKADKSAAEKPAKKPSTKTKAAAKSEAK